MLRRWSKQHLLTVGLNFVRWQRPDKSLQVLPVKPAGKLLLPDLLDLTVQLEGIASQLQGQAVSVQISQPLMRYQLLPWQKSIVQRQDWLAMAKQNFIDIYGSVAQQWQYLTHFQGYGRPVLAMATDAGLLALIDEQAKKSGWHLKGVLPELLAIADQHRRQIKAHDWLLLSNSASYFLLAERQKQRWQAIHVFTFGPMALTNNVEAILNQRQQSYESLPILTVWTDVTDSLPPNLAGLDLKPLSSRPSMLANNQLLASP